MESKYYTPDISEFHVGFEYEVFDSKYEYKVEKLSETKLKVLSDPITTTGWFKEAYEIDSFLYVEDSSDIKSNIPSYIENDKVRVKYLDREDIESLGFIESKETEGLLSIGILNKKLAINVRNCAYGKRKTACGFIWSYYECENILNIDNRGNRK